MGVMVHFISKKCLKKKENPKPNDFESQFYQSFLAVVSSFEILHKHRLPPKNIELKTFYNRRPHNSKHSMFSYVE